MQIAVVLLSMNMLAAMAWLIPSDSRKLHHARAAIGRSANDAVKGTSTLNVATANMPLVGFPSWAPPLHTVVLFYEEKSIDKGKAFRACSMGFKEGWLVSPFCPLLSLYLPPTRLLPPGSYILFDFLPSDPTAISTAFSLLTGGSVEGIVREKIISFTPRSFQAKGPCLQDLGSIRAFAQSYDCRLNLLNNQCYTFAEALMEFCLKEPPP